MKNLSIKLVLFLILLTASYAEVNSSTVSVQNSTQNQVSLIDIAGKQRMLSQRMAKDYLYKGKHVATAKASKQLVSAMGEFQSAQKTLQSSINDEEIKNLLEFVQMSMDEFKAIAQQPFDLNNAQLVIDLGESILEGSQYVVDSIKKKANHKESNIVAISGKQRMLSQRIAKYYIAYQSGINDKNTVDQMNETVISFTKNLNTLMSNSSNTTQINQKLNEINKLWKIVYKFYLGIEKGGLPFIVYTTTDNITKKMDEITKLYVKLYQK
jgi:nitrate/nitrite-specific signal transduction histidine kinase